MHKMYRKQSVFNSLLNCLVGQDRVLKGYPLNVISGEFLHVTQADMFDFATSVSCFSLTDLMSQVGFSSIGVIDTLRYLFSFFVGTWALVRMIPSQK